MKNHFKYSILTILTLALTISLVTASPATIGGTNQILPFEGKPSAASYFMVGGPPFAGIMNMMDGDLSTTGDFFLGAPHIIRPNGQGFYTAWLESPSGAGYLAWNQEVSDADATYVHTSSTTTGPRETSTLEDPPSEASGTISSVTVYVVARRTGTAGGITPFLRLSGVDLSGTAITLTTSYVLSSRVIGRPGGGTWTWADITSLEAGVLLSTAASATSMVRVTQLYVEVAGPTTGFFELNTFGTSPAAFPIGWVDIKMKYSVPTAAVDDSYVIQFTTGTNPWVDLQPTVTGAATGFDPGGTDSLGRVWTQQAEPSGDGVWDWGDIASLRVRVTVTRGGAAFDNVKMFINDVWVTASQSPTPPSASTALSLQPSLVAGLTTGQTFFVDIYVAGMSGSPGLWGWQITIVYDTSVLTATEWYTYHPFIGAAPSAIDDTAGYVSVSYFTFAGDTVGFTGANTTLGRVYFSVDATGTSRLDLIDQRPTYITELAPVAAPAYVPPLYDATYGPPKFMSAQPPALINLANPLMTQWHELYPRYSNAWTLTSWIDNGDTVLSASDQIDMLNATGWKYWFHVDQVTITIHWTFKPPTEGKGEAEPVSPMTEMPPGDPRGSRWHQIYPTYSRTFTISSWTDQNGNGNFDPSDQFDWEYDDEPGTVYNAHLDNVSTDLILSQKGEPEPPTGPVPEFPFGLGLIMLIAPLIPVAYLWKLRKKVTKP